MSPWRRRGGSGSSKLGSAARPRPGSSTASACSLRALRAVLFFFFVITLVLIGVEAELLGLEHGHQEVLALGVVCLHELLVELIDELLQLVVAQVDLDEERGVHLETPVVEVDPADAPSAAVDDEDLARLCANGPLEAGGFHRMAQHTRAERAKRPAVPVATLLAWPIRFASASSFRSRSIRSTPSARPGASPMQPGSITSGRSIISSRSATIGHSRSSTAGPSSAPSRRTPHARASV